MQSCMAVAVHRKFSTPSAILVSFVLNVVPATCSKPNEWETRVYVSKV